jgi:hypothetical protein
MSTPDSSTAQQIRIGSVVEVLRPPRRRKYITNAALYRGSTGTVICSDMIAGILQWAVRLDHATVTPGSSDRTVYFRQDDLKVIGQEVSG